MLTKVAQHEVGLAAELWVTVAMFTYLFATDSLKDSNSRLNGLR